jgi:hypothetical protein
MCLPWFWSGFGHVKKKSTALVYCLFGSTQHHPFLVLKHPGGVSFPQPHLWYWILFGSSCITSPEHSYGERTGSLVTLQSHAKFTASGSHSHLLVFRRCHAESGDPASNSTKPFQLGIGAGRRLRPVKIGRSAFTAACLFSGGIILFSGVSLVMELNTSSLVGEDTRQLCFLERGIGVGGVVHLLPRQGVTTSSWSAELETSSITSSLIKNTILPSYSHNFSLIQIFTIHLITSSPLFTHLNTSIKFSLFIRYSFHLFSPI